MYNEVVTMSGQHTLARQKIYEKMCGLVAGENHRFYFALGVMNLFKPINIHIQQKQAILPL
jgi:hypothetical protein